MWQAEADKELTLSASPTTVVGQNALALATVKHQPFLEDSANLIVCYSYVPVLSNVDL